VTPGRASVRIAWAVTTVVGLLLTAVAGAAPAPVGLVAVRPLAARSAPDALGPGGATQEVVVSAPTYASQTATLSAYQYANGLWHLAYGPVTAELGFNGLSDNRQENDGTTPTGTYGIGSTMYGLGSSLNSRYSYHNLVCGDWWSGEHDATYNQFVHVPCGQNLPNSEALWQQTTAYQHFAVINFNLNPTVQGRGSGIFLHDNTPSGVTAGCIAIAPGTLDSVLGWLDPAQNPVIRIGTTSQVSPPSPLDNGLGAPPPNHAGNLLANGSFEASAALSGWRTADGFSARSYNDPNSAHDGQWVANGYTTTPGGSLFQDVAVTAAAGQSFVGTVWVHSNEGFGGALALFALGSADADVTYFSAGPGWTQVQVPLDLRSGPISGIRFQLYAYTVGHNLTFDGAHLT
jgi:L,D-peptidoglycan transpeptidase YkuD (ErfK/YbiS/YcfS/YnhG family)